MLLALHCLTKGAARPLQVSPSTRAKVWFESITLITRCSGPVLPCPAFFPNCKRFTSRGEAHPSLYPHSSYSLAGGLCAEPACSAESCSLQNAVGRRCRRSVLAICVTVYALSLLTGYDDLGQVCLSPAPVVHGWQGECAALLPGVFAPSFKGGCAGMQPLLVGYSPCSTVQAASAGRQLKLQPGKEAVSSSLSRPVNPTVYCLHKTKFWGAHPTCIYYTSCSLLQPSLHHFFPSAASALQQIQMAQLTRRLPLNSLVHVHTHSHYTPTHNTKKH